MAYKSDPRGARAVSLVAAHTAEGARTATSLGAYFYQAATQASSHVGIDAGATLQYVGYDRSAWTIRSGNPISDNAEICGFAHWTREQWLSTATADGCPNPRAMLDRTAAWIRSRCLARGIPIRKLTSAQVAAGQSGVIGHVDWTNGMHDGTHTDPGSGFPWDYVIAKASEGGSTGGGGSPAAPSKALNGEEPVVIDTFPNGTRELTGFKPKLGADGKPTGELEPVYEVKTWVLPYVLPVGVTSSMISDAWISVKCAGGGAIEYVRLMSIRNQAQYSLPGGGYPQDVEFKGVTAVDSDKDRAAIKASDGQDSFTVMIRSAVPFSVCIETKTKVAA
jgi:hypothetical protein